MFTPSHSLIATFLPDSGDLINFEYSTRNMNMSMQDYMKVICGSQKVNVGALSKTDRKGIKAGRAFKGMTKKGIRIALGYPAEHRTPSLDDNSWTYWTNRFKTTVVEFNGNGRVASVR